MSPLRRKPDPLRPILPAALALTATLAFALGCNVVDAVRGRSARIVKMVPGGNVATGGLDCWLTFELSGFPDGADPTDLKVRFRSVALNETAVFDWAYIAEHDVLAEGGRFGSGHRPAPDTRPDAPPPLGEPIKVRFPLDARDRIDEAPATLWLDVEVLQGGRPMDDARRTIEHVYSRSGNDFF